MNGQPGKIPLLAGLAAARANLVPGLIIQATMLALVLAYYFHPPTRQALDILASWKHRFGYGFTFVLLGLTGGILPEILRIIVFQHGKLRAANGYNFVFGFLFWGFIGCCTDTFYRGQALLFGTQVTALTITKKVALDMLVYTPLWGTPAVVCVYEWKQDHFLPRGVGRILTARFYRETVFPVLIANWGVWIPVVTVIYALPLLLQVPLFALATSFWSLLVAYMASGKPPGTL